MPGGLRHPPIVEPPVCFKQGTGFWGDDRWGDYSATTLDPLDPETFWTVQQYMLEEGVWETWITQIRIQY